MRSSWLLVMPVYLFAIIGIWTVVNGQNEAPASNKDDPMILSVDFDSATVGDVLNLLFNEAQINFSVTHDVLSVPVGKLRLSNRRISEILDYICQQSGLSWRRDEKGVYILTRRQVESTTPPKSSEETKKEELPPTPRVVSQEEFHRRISDQPILYELIRLRYIPIPDVGYLLGFPVQGISSYESAFQMAAFWRNQVTQTPFTSNSPILPSGSIPSGGIRQQNDSLLKANWAPYQSSLNSPFSSSPERAWQGMWQAPETAGQLIGGGGVGPGGGIGGPPGAAGGAPTGGILGLIPGLEQIIGIPTQNAVLVRGTPDAIRQLREILALIDQPPDQVEIESQFVAVSGSLTDIFGIDWKVSGSEVSVVTQGMPLGALLQIGFVRGDLDAVLGAAITSNKGKIIQAPRAFTVNGLPAVFTSFTVRPVIIQFQTTDLAGNVRTITTIQPIPISITLFTTPFINEDDTVTMFLSPSVSDIVGEVPNPIPGAGTIPIINTTFTQALVRVRNGESVAIGGLLTTRDSHTRKEVPLLARLPLIGSLFRGKDRTISEQNLVIFVTPRIIRLEELPIPPAG